MDILLILLSVFFSSVAQMLLKLGMAKVGTVRLQTGAIMDALPKVIYNYYIISGCIGFGLSLFLWLIVLSRTSVSYAYPFVSIGYVLITVLGYFFLSEPISVTRIVGLAVIIIGLLVFAQG